jgi:hypothetical protein
MEPKGLAAGSSDSTRDQRDALNQNRAHREHTGIRDVLPTIPGTDSAVGDRDWALALGGQSGKNVRSAQAPPALTGDGCGRPKAKNWRRGRDSNP